MKKYILACIISLICLCSFSVEYYVDVESRGGPADDNGPGTQEKPWRTLSRALRPSKTAVGAGDVIWLRGGTYRETGDLANNGIEIKSYDNEKAVIDGEGKRYYGITLTGCTNVQVAGIEFRNFARGGGGSAISVRGSSGITLRKVKVSGAQIGIWIYSGSSRCAVKDSELFENEGNICVGPLAGYILISGNYCHHSIGHNVGTYSPADRCIGHGELASVKPYQPGLAVLTMATGRLDNIRSFRSAPAGQDEKRSVKNPDYVLLYPGTNNPIVLAYTKLPQEIQGGGHRLFDGREGFVLRNNPEWENKPFSPDGKSVLIETGAARPEQLAPPGYALIARVFDPAGRPHDVQIISNEIAYSGCQGIIAPCADRILIKGNNVHHSFATGLQVETAARNFWIEGNRFWANAIGGSETGCWLDEMREGVVQDNIIYENQRGIYFSQSEWIVVRRNYIFRNQSQFVTDTNKSQQASQRNTGAFGFSGGHFEHFGAYPGMRHMAFVHNTCYANGHPTSVWGDMWYGVGGTCAISGNNPVLNNIFQEGIGAAAVRMDGTMPEVMDGNIYYRKEGVKFHYKNQDRDFAGFQKETGLDSNSFVAAVAFADPAKDDYRLARGSAAIDKGWPLTTALGAGNGNRIVVADTCFFTAGFKDGNGSLIIPGDEIMVANAQARITEIDRQNGILVLDRSVSWKAGNPVSYVYSGLAPDIGADEHMDAGIKSRLDKIKKTLKDLISK